MHRRQSVHQRRAWAWALAIAATSAAKPASADLAKFEIDGRIFTKHLYQNDDNQGLLSLGNPFWPDDVAGHNGIGSELELIFRGRVSQLAEAGARVASRFGERWHDWWESGAAWYDRKTNTSGDSAGMNRASYLKLRGSYIQLAPELSHLDYVRIGASDFSMFNPWTIGKVRYIDRDNGRGYFLGGKFGDDNAGQYYVAAIAMPKLWVGPSWSTGIGDPALSQAFWSRDWAYAAMVRYRVGDSTTVRLVGDVTQDLEVNTADPDAVGSRNPTCKDGLGNAIPGCAPDHAVDLLTRYASLNATFDVESEPLDWLRVQGLLGVSAQRIDPKLAGNGVQLNQGVYPLVYKDTSDVAGTLRLSASDPFDVGLSLQGEYFYIGPDWNAIFGARREADVLLTDGLVGSGGQLPTLNLANEFVDFDDEWVESCIGWHGATGVLTLDKGDTRLRAEYTHIEYATNGQDRDVDRTYPDFLHGDGFTDTLVYDYANVSDRGRDPRSVYRRNQFRRTDLAVLQLKHQFEVGSGLDVEVKGKYIKDVDYRRLNGQGALDDDYAGDIANVRVKLSMPVADGLRLGVHGQVDHWNEVNRKGTLQLGYGDDATDRQVVGLTANLSYGGVRFAYLVEYLHKTQDRQREPDQLWNVWRSKAVIEAAW
ncbi:MAG: hypothetical protein FJ100_06510 [Deltaproteobacteria bacterium]|nr:hypothetical protein [Deltaproteobacteria bacterium]